jgi:glycosyltransferase involved in cell wall biosynthesis
MRPSISALLPVYNGMRWLQRSIINVESVLSESDELIIVDNGSTDGTTEFLQSYRFKRATVLLFQKEKGLVDALNAGLSAAQNNWIARFDVDDLYEPHRLENIFKSLRPSTVAIFSDFDFVDVRGDSYGTFYNAVVDPAIKLSLPRSERNAHPSVVYRKKEVIDVGGYLKEDYPCEDLSLWLRLAKVGSFQGSPLPLLHYSFLTDSVSSQNYQLIQANTMKIVERYFDPTIVANAYQQLNETLRQYSSHPNGLARKLLHLRDFLHPVVWKNLSFLNKFKVVLFLLLYFSRPKSWKITFKLFKERRKRTQYRN